MVLVVRNSYYFLTRVTDAENTHIRMCSHALRARTECFVAHVATACTSQVYQIVLYRYVRPSYSRTSNVTHFCVYLQVKSPDPGHLLLDLENFENAHVINNAQCLEFLEHILRNSLDFHEQFTDFKVRPPHRRSSVASVYSNEQHRTENGTRSTAAAVSFAPPNRTATISEARRMLLRGTSVSNLLSDEKDVREGPTTSSRLGQRKRDFQEEKRDHRSREPEQDVVSHSGGSVSKSKSRRKPVEDADEKDHGHKLDSVDVEGSSGVSSNASSDIEDSDKEQEKSEHHSTHSQRDEDDSTEPHTAHDHADVSNGENLSTPHSRPDTAHEDDLTSVASATPLLPQNGNAPNEKRKSSVSRSHSHSHSHSSRSASRNSPTESSRRNGEGTHERLVDEDETVSVQKYSSLKSSHTSPENEQVSVVDLSDTGSVSDADSEQNVEYASFAPLVPAPPPPEDEEGDGHESEGNVEPAGRLVENSPSAKKSSRERSTSEERKESFDRVESEPARVEPQTKIPSPKSRLSVNSPERSSRSESGGAKRGGRDTAASVSGTGKSAGDSKRAHFRTPSAPNSARPKPKRQYRNRAKMLLENRDKSPSLSGDSEDDNRYGFHSAMVFFTWNYAHVHSSAVWMLRCRTYRIFQGSRDK